MFKQVREMLVEADGGAVGWLIFQVIALAIVLINLSSWNMQSEASRCAVAGLHLGTAILLAVAPTESMEKHWLARWGIPTFYVFLAFITIFSILVRSLLVFSGSG